MKYFIIEPKFAQRFKPYKGNVQICCSNGYVLDEDSFKPYKGNVQMSQNIVTIWL